MEKQKTKKKTHTLIISDLHLGSSVSQPQKALEVIENHSFRKLILLGDVFDSLDFRYLSKESWEFLARMGELSKTKKIRWVIGNHDQGLTNIFGSLIDSQVYETYTWRYKHEKYLAIHGHQFDRFLIDNAFISYWANVIYNYIQRIDSEERKFSHYLKRKSKGFLRLSEKVARGAIHYGKKNGAQYVFCGHTHKALHKRNHEIKYYNSGCFADKPCTYITIDEENINICYY